MVLSSCRSCRGTVLDQVLDLGSQPASDHFPAADDPGPDPTWPLGLVLCRTCGLVQLTLAEAPVPEAPRAVESATMRTHALASARWLVETLRPSTGATLVEFDSHHGGGWSDALHDLGLRPATGHADVVLDVHGMAHDEDLDAALAQRAARVGDAGLFVMEFHHLLALVEGGQFDTVRHGHPVYLSLAALQPALRRHGLTPLLARPVAAYGGSLVVVAGRRGDADPSVAAVLAAEAAAGLTDPARLGGLQQVADRAGPALHRWLAQSTDAGLLTVGYGAPSKAAILLTWAGVGPDLLPYTADLSPAKHGRRIPGCGVPIRSPEDLLADRPDQVLVLTWDIVDEVRAQLAAVETTGGRFFVPVPTCRPA